MATASIAKANKEMKRAEKRAQRNRAELERLREEHAESIASVTRTVMTTGGAFAVAYWMGRNPERTEILGVAAPLAVGAAATTAALMGWAGEQTEMVEAFGAGALAVYATTKGYDMGKEAHEKAAA